MRTVSRLITSGIFLLLSALLAAMAAKATDIFSLWWPKVSQWFLKLVGGVTGALPFPIWQILVLFLVVWLFVTLFRDIKKGKIISWLTGVLWAACLFVFVFMLFWGAGHFLPSKTEQIVTLEQSSVEELKSAAAFFGEQASMWADEVARDEDGQMQPGDFRALSDEVNAQFARLSEQYPCIPEAKIYEKKLILGKAMSYLGVTGIFVPHTAEICVNPNTFCVSLPFTMCHEAAHRIGANAEEDANFCAFLACVGSENPEMRYSGWYSAFLYCYNALYEQAPTLAEEVWSTALSAQVQKDVVAASAHYAPYEGKVQDEAQKVNNAYLEAFGKAGVKSYGLVSDALIAWQKAQMNAYNAAAALFGSV